MRQQYPLCGDHAIRFAACLLGLRSIFVFGAIVFGSSPAVFAGDLELRIVDTETGELTAALLNVRDRRGRARFPDNALRRGDWFVCLGKCVFDLPTGDYEFTASRGPEYRLSKGYFTIGPAAADNKEIEIQRIVSLKKEGWWSADIGVQEKPNDIPAWLAATDCQAAWLRSWQLPVPDPVPVPPRPLLDEDRPADRLIVEAAGTCSDPTGGMLYILGPDKQPENLPTELASGTGPCLVKLIEQPAKETSAVAVASSPLAADFPMWVASERLAAVCVATSSLSPRKPKLTKDEALPKSLRDEMVDDATIATMTAYFRLLETGVQLPAVAATHGFVTEEPACSCRTYVRLADKPIDQPLTAQEWLTAMRAGNTVVTNGPLLRPTFNTHPPGTLFSLAAGETLEVTIGLNLSIRDPVEYLEIIQNGKVIHEVRLSDWAKAGGKLPTVTFKETGWLTVRAVSSSIDQVTFAMSGPIYVNIGEQPRISKSASQWMLDRVMARGIEIKNDKSLADAARAEQLRYHGAAAEFWKKRVEQANVE